MNLSEIPRNGIVYRLLLGDYHYTGSTLETIHRRVLQHKDASIRGGNRKLYKHILANGGWDTVKVLVLEEGIPEKNLLQKEQSYINIHDPFCLNSYSAVGTVVPKKQTIRSEKKKAYDSSYYEANKERLKQKRLDYYHSHKEDPEFREKHRHQCREASQRSRSKNFPS